MAKHDDGVADVAQDQTTADEIESRRAASLPDGSSAGAGGGNQDTASGGAPDDDIRNDPDGTPVENPSG